MHELAFNWVVVTYFFLGGLSAGCFLFSVAANYWLTDYKPLARKAAIASLVVLAFGTLFLLFDLGQPMRAWRLFFAGNTSSVGFWGTWFLTIFGLLIMAYLWFLYKNNETRAKQIGLVGVAMAIVVATYTAFLLNGAPGRELWNSSILPLLFQNGALISGLALVLLLAAIDESTKPLVSKLGKLIAFLVLLELGMLLVELLIAGVHVVVGEYAVLFWVLQIIFGALVPVAILLSYDRLSTQLTSKPYFAAIAPVLVLVGIYTMRYIVVIGGQV